MKKTKKNKTVESCINVNAEINSEVIWNDEKSESKKEKKYSISEEKFYIETEGGSYNDKATICRTNLLY